MSAVAYTERSGRKHPNSAFQRLLLLTLPLEAESLVDKEFPAKGEEGHDDGDAARHGMLADARLAGRGARRTQGPNLSGDVLELAQALRGSVGWCVVNSGSMAARPGQLAYHPAPASVGWVSTWTTAHCRRTAPLHSAATTAPTAIMSDNENGDDMVTKPFKFVTAGMTTPDCTAPHVHSTSELCARGRPQHANQRSVPQASTRASPTRTRPSTAGRTTSTTTSASSPRARTLLPAASSCWPTSRSAPAAGPHDGMTSVRPATSPSTSTSKCSLQRNLRTRQEMGRVDHRLAYAPQYLYHIDRHNAALIPQPASQPT
ncbi:hypothetical protein OPT61_g8165 [Boeremia exigua]|uniref:Uncharacterized protein n=1 Tax=Boeremia exigua TaxID=749465 RepID=A0ACC2I109_9PLEO|nr:hypothetical protein OPT61_g8165 [Boeremia exigua]